MLPCRYPHHYFVVVSWYQKHHFQGRLADKIESGEVVPVMVPMISTTNTTQQEDLREEEEGERN